MNATKILCVDDEPRVLEGLKNTLDWDYDVVTAPGGPQGLKLLAEDPEIRLVLSDMRMPDMSGAVFLSEVRVRFPEVTRMLLTGYADIESAMHAVNEGGIFRMLLKPCPSDSLKGAIADGLAHNALLRSERELLDHTLRGTVEALTDALSLSSPSLFARARRLRELVRHAATSLDLEARWELEMGALLSVMGLMAVEESTVEKFLIGAPLTSQEQEALAHYPEIGAKLVEHVPRLGGVAALVRFQNTPNAAPRPDRAELIHAAIVVCNAISRGTTPRDALAAAHVRGDLVKVFEDFHAQPGEWIAKSVGLAQLTPSMRLDADVLSKTGQLLVKKGTELSFVRIEWLRNYDLGVGVAQPVKVLVQT